jgi:hypothetical protein
MAEEDVPGLVEIVCGSRLTLRSLSCSVNFCSQRCRFQRCQQCGYVPIAIYSTETLLGV